MSVLKEPEKELLLLCFSKPNKAGTFNCAQRSFPINGEVDFYSALADAIKHYNKVKGREGFCLHLLKNENDVG